MKSFFRFAGGLSLDYGIVIEEYPEYHTAQRVIETQTVPGRSGNLVFDTGAYGNVEQEYTVHLKAKPNTLHQAARRAAIWLQSPRGYQVLEDSYDPEVFRKAVFTGPLELTNWFERYGGNDYIRLPAPTLAQGRPNIPGDYIRGNAVQSRRSGLAVYRGLRERGRYADRWKLNCRYIVHTL